MRDVDSSRIRPIFVNRVGQVLTVKSDCVGRVGSKRVLVCRVVEGRMGHADEAPAVFPKKLIQRAGDARKKQAQDVAERLLETLAPRCLRKRQVWRGDFIKLHSEPQCFHSRSLRSSAASATVSRTGP